MTDLSFLDQQALNDWIVAQRWFASKTREVSQIEIVDQVTLREESPVARAVPGRGALPDRDARDLPGAARLAPGRRGLVRARDRRVRRLDRLRRARRSGRRPRAAAPDALQQRVPGRPGRVHLPLGAERAATPRLGGTVDVRPVGVEQSNSSIVFGDHALVPALVDRAQPERHLVGLVGPRREARLDEAQDDRGRLLAQGHAGRRCRSISRVLEANQRCATSQSLNPCWS